MEDMNIVLGAANGNEPPRAEGKDLTYMKDINNVMGTANGKDPPDTEGEDLTYLYEDMAPASVARMKGMHEGVRNCLLRLRRNILQHEEEKRAAEMEAERRRMLGLPSEAEQEEAEAAKRQAAILAQQREEDIALVRKKFGTAAGLSEAGLPLMFHGCTLKSIVERGLPVEHAYPKQRVSDYIEKMPRMAEQGVGLILSGTVGTLKTSFASAIMLAGIEKGIAGHFELVMSLMDDLVVLERKNPVEYAQKMDMLCQVPLLVLDDLGAEGSHADFVRKKLEQIIFYRHANKKSMIVTTNLTPEELERMYTRRVTDRLRECCPMLVMQGKSLRSVSAY